MAARASIRLRNLRHVDPYVWVFPPVGSIPPAYYPAVLDSPPGSQYGFIYYREWYYYSENPNYPYVCLVTHPDSQLPLVRCCDKTTWEEFTTKYKRGDYDGFGMPACISVYTNENKSDL